jgi:hypothetical protein
MSNKSDQISHDIPDFDATMRRLVRVPKSEVKGEGKRSKEKKRKAG